MSTITNEMKWIIENNRLSKECQRLESIDNKSIKLVLSIESLDKEYNDLIKTRTLSIRDTNNKLKSFKNAMSNINDSISKASPDILQKILESFESRLSVYKNTMRHEYIDLESQEQSLYNELLMYIEKINKYDDDNNDIKNNDNKNINDIKKKKQQQQLADRYNNDMNKQAEIGLIDRQLASLGRTGGWDSMEHDVFIRIWFQLNCNAKIIKQLKNKDQDSSSNNSMIMSVPIEVYTLPSLVKNSILRKGAQLIPGKSIDDTEAHIYWYLEYLELTARKKAVLSKWKETKFQDNEKDTSIEELTDDKVVVNELDEAEKAALRARISKWKADKAEQQRQEELAQKKKKKQDELQQVEERRKKQQHVHARLEQWREAEAKSREKVKEAAKVIMSPKRTSDDTDLEIRRQRDMEMARKRRELTENKINQLTARERNIKNMDPKLDIVEAVQRDPERLLASTKASTAYKISAEELDDLDSRRKTASAHSSNIALSGRDLAYGGRAMPNWCRGVM
jgi:hypothetical protein